MADSKASKSTIVGNTHTEKTAVHFTEAEESANGFSDEYAELSDEMKIGFTVNDQKDMRRMGKQQEFRRNFRVITSIGFTSCVMGTWEIFLTSNTQGLIAGGKAGVFWSVTWAYAGQFLVVLSLAEMASMAPTAGGQYHWVSEFAPQKYQRFLSYTSGWLSTLAWQDLFAINCYLVGIIIQGLITVNNSTYTATLWQGTLLIFASVIGVACFNIFAAKQLPLAEGIFLSFHFIMFFVVIVTVLVMAPKQSASEVFTGFTDNGANWPSISLTVLVGQVTGFFTVLGTDAVAHMSEEIEDAATVVPQAMVWSYILNLPFAYGAMLTFLFCLDNVDNAVTSPTGFPFIYVFQQATQSVAGTTVLVIIMLLLLFMITISGLASTSRQTFAFARDRGLPFSNWLGRVHPTFHIPINSIIFSCGFTMALSLINIGSTVAFNAMLSLSTVALMATYILSIGCVVLKRIRGEPLPTSRWTLGRWGLPVNIFSLLYAFWSFFWSFWPNSHDVTAVNFNWASVLFVAVMSVATLLYFTHASTVYEGPVAKVEGRKLN